ncbi:MAG: class I SAM-dependent methyltransferase [Ignavibacteria bacterium]|nr:class I SAM-dependent methyltransferase [Ignavibacteria bacterium]
MNSTGKIEDNWYKQWFNNKEYLELYKHRNSADAKAIAGLIMKNVPLKKGSYVLDLACGNGRHSVIIASKGFKVLGVDLSTFLISEARKKLKSDYSRYTRRLSFEIRDMRKLGFKNEFDMVVNLFSSFAYFRSDRQNKKVISEISASLKTGGFFFFDFLNESYVRRNLVPFDMTKRNRKVIIQVREITGGFVKKNIIIVSNSGGGSDNAVSSFYEMIRLYSLSDLRKMFKDNGLRILKTFGDYSGSKFNKKNSERLIILAQKTINLKR